MPLITGALFACTTVIVKAASETLSVPSETEMTMPGCGPTAADPGVPLKRPVDWLKLAQSGFPLMLKLSACPSGSEAVGRNEYALPAVTASVGEPLMTGARLTGGGGSPAETLMAKAGSDRDAAPSDTEITIPENRPTSSAAGVPGELAGQRIEARPGRQVGDAEAQDLSIRVCCVRRERISVANRRGRDRRAGNRRRRVGVGIALDLRGRRPEARLQPCCPIR